ncbi:MAG TPA: DUF1800 domain-containing protein [Alphaproteobacteria bacterium]|nr:DUF1800 domain-containing protein [Alphaproteobacteria bacterium]
MRATRKAIFLLTFALLAFATLAAIDKKPKPSGKNTPLQMDESKKIQHALSRLTFGARPGDVERVQSIGLDNWFEEQLRPEKIDDSALDSRLAPFRTLRMSTREMVQNFPPPQVLRAVENGRMSMPSDPAKRAIYESRMEAYQQRQNKKADAKADEKMGDETSMSPGSQKMAEERMYGDLDSVELLHLTPEERYQKLLKMTVAERTALAQSLRGPQGMQQFVEGMKPEQRETVEAIVNPQVVVGRELTQGKLLRAVYSERQLDEVMTDFWFNHFNIFVGKGPDRYMITAYERDVIRPHALGKFKDLLVATAKSPAMLFYLDNWQSVGPHSDMVKYGPPGRARPRFGLGGIMPRGNPARDNRPNPNPANRPSGLNENYAREIMELHTLGVDGGYTQKDVTELAKVFTGWSIVQPQLGGDFVYNGRVHEPGTKLVLGHKIKDKGEGEALEVMDILAHHPSTARFISRKLAMRFVSDNPPQSLVDRMAETFKKTDGDIREVLRTMFHAPEFWAADAYRAKVKTPLEFVASSVRASGVEVKGTLYLAQTLNRMGMPLYAMQPPTGYSMKADAWVNSSALLNRMNFALMLGSGRVPGTSPNLQALLRGAAPPQDTDSALSLLEGELLAGDVSEQTHSVIQKRLNDPQVTQRRLDDPDRTPNYGAIAGLIMGSPEFQRR